MDLVENNELVPVVREIELGLTQFGAILLGFEVEVMRIETPPRFQRQRRLAHLPRTQQPNSRVIFDGIDEMRIEGSLYHPCNNGLLILYLQG